MNKDRVPPDKSAIDPNQMAKPPGTKTVAVVGASNDRAKYGNIAVRAYLQDGWDVYPVHPTAHHVENVEAFARVSDIPVPLDRVTLYLPPEVGLTVLEDIAQARPKEFYINPGAGSQQLIEEAKALGLEPIEACSIVAIGISPSQV